jgi:hypothetical protein
MIKTLRITSVVAAILAVIGFIFPVVFGGRSDERIEGFLKSPTVMEKFNSAMGSQAKTSESRSSPLVQQAEAFALYLSPRGPNGAPAVREGGITPVPLPVSPQFTVIATTYYEAQPELSLALIDEPGKGLHWVRQSSQVGHLVIEQVRDSLVVVKGGKGTFELPVEQRPQMSLLEGASRIPNGASGVLKGASPVSKPARGQTGSKSTLTTSGRTGAAVTRPRSRLPQRQLNTEKNVQLEELADRLKELQKSYKSDKTDSGFSPEERAALTEKLISNYKSSRVGSEEAKKLGDLGKQLENVREDPNGSLPATSRSKKRSKPAQNKPMRK